MEGRKEGWTDGRTDRYNNGHRDTDTKKKEEAIPTVASSVNQQELVDLDYKYYAAVVGNFFSHDVRMEKISWTDHVRNEEVLLRVNEQRNILHEIRKRKANWIGHILSRN